MVFAVAILCVLIIVGAVAVAVALRPKGPPPKLCGGCRRILGTGWSRCLFCGYELPEAIPRLQFIGGPLAGQTFPLKADVTTIGSVAGNTIVLSDPGVSRKHIGIRKTAGAYELADLGSTNGVYINGYRMATKVLEPGDVLRLGSSELVFHSG